jgi:hypothetical protein
MQTVPLNQMADTTQDHLAGADAKAGVAFTPGPWRICGQYNAVKDEIGAEGRAVATVWTRQISRRVDGTDAEAWPEGEANARLIAAAPVMYEALEQAERRLFGAWQMLEAICETDFSRDRKAAADKALAGLESVRAALSKATGVSQ